MESRLSFHALISEFFLRAPRGLKIDESSSVYVLGLAGLGKREL